MTATKPPYSKDRRLQLCYACNRYCGRNERFCPRDDCPSNRPQPAVNRAGYCEHCPHNGGYCCVCGGGPEIGGEG